MTPPRSPGTQKPRCCRSMTPPVTPDLPPSPTVPSIAEQLSTLQHTITQQATRLERTEQANTRLSADLDSARARIDVLERHNAFLASRRREAVAQFHTMRPLYHESANAFDMRATNVQPDDLESMLCIQGSTMMTVVNAQQRAIAHLSQQLREQGAAAAQHGQMPQSQGSAAIQGTMGTGVVGYAYPAAYMQNGYCRAHLVAYPCRVCGH